MPGICAIAGLGPQPSLQADIVAMVRRMRHYPWLREAQHVDLAGGVALGSVALDATINPRYQTPNGQTVVFLDGEIHDAAAERRRLRENGVAFDGDSDAELILKGWLHSGERFLTGLHGMFSAIVWDARTKALTIVTDRFGLRPVYVAQAGGRLFVASEMKAVLMHPSVNRQWSESGVSQFFAFGHLLNDDTLFSGIRALRGGICARYTLGDETLRIDPYWVPRPDAVSGSVPDLLDALDESLVSAVQRRCTSGGPFGISLSGGMDARTILGLIPPGAALSSLSIGIEGSIDHRSAATLAQLAGVPQHQYVLNASFLDDFEPHLKQMVLLTDGHYLDQGIVVPTLSRYRELGIRTLFRGHGGELFHMKKAYAFSLDERAMSASEQDLEEWLYRHLSAYMLSGVPPSLFSLNIQESARASLHQAYRDAENFEPIQRVWQLFLTQRLHRETAVSMHKFGCFSNIRLPFIDNDVLDVLFALPARMKLGDELQCRILRRRRPEFLDVVNSNTGTRPGANRLSTEFARTRLRIYSRLGVRGYQPYERLGLWLARDLRGFVERILFSERFLDRKLVQPDGIRTVVAQHAAREANHTFLLMSLLIFELGQRMLEDPDHFLDEENPRPATAAAAKASTARARIDQRSMYDRACETIFWRMREWLTPELLNSHYAYRALLRQFLEGTGRWLDLGCGHDFLPAWFVDQERQMDVSRWQIVGVDLDDASLRRHRSLDLAVHGDVARLPFRSNTFNLVTANMVLEHLKEPRPVFQEISRVLAPGGLFLAHTPNAVGYSTRLARLLPNRILAPLAQTLLNRKAEDIYPTYYRANSSQELEILGEQAQLQRHSLEFVSSTPQFVKIPPLMMVELGLIRILEMKAFESKRACIVTVLRKGESADALPAAGVLEQVEQGT